MSVGAITGPVGGELQGWAALLDRLAMRKAFKEEMGRQGEYRKQAGQVFQGGLDQSSAEYAQSQMDKGSQNRQALYQRLAYQPMTTTGVGPTARDYAYGQQQGKARANLGGYSDWQQQQGIDTLNRQRALDRIYNFAGGTAQVFPYRMYDAQHKMDTLAQIGQMISSMGGGSSNFSAYATAPGGVTPGTGGYGAGTVYPMGHGGAYGNMPGYDYMPGYMDAYGQYYPAGWNTLGGSYEGTVIPG